MVEEDVRFISHRILTNLISLRLCVCWGGFSSSHFLRRWDDQILVVFAVPSVGLG